MPVSISKKTPKSASNDVTTLSGDALAAIQKAVAVLPTDPNPEQSQAGRSGRSISDEAMALAVKILLANPKRFPEYDVASLQKAIAYEQAMRPLGTQVTAFGEQITQSARLHRGDAAKQTYALYQTLKGLSTGLARLSKTDPLRAQAQEMKKLMTTTKKSRATELTQAESDALLKKGKATKVAASKVAEAMSAVADAARVAGAAGVPAPTVVMASASPPAVTPTASEPTAPAPAAVTTGH